MVDRYDITGKNTQEKRILANRLEGVKEEIIRLTGRLVTLSFEKSDLPNSRSADWARSRAEVEKGGIQEVKHNLDALKKEKKDILEKLKNLPKF